MASLGDATALAGLADVDYSTAYRWLKGETRPYNKFLHKIADAKGVSREWLRTGEGDMLLAGQGDGGTPTTTPTSAALVAHASPADDLYRIADVAVEVAAGDGTTPPDGAPRYELEDQGGEVYYPGWFIRSEFGIEPQRLKTVRVVGTSMMPTLLPGSRVYVALQNGDPLRDGGVYVLLSPDGLLIKRLFFEQREDASRHVLIHSDNPDAPSYTVPAEVFGRD
ncbi:MAG: S24 family peptidase, partial [Bacteroidota bacterium]